MHFSRRRPKGGDIYIHFILTYSIDPKNQYYLFNINRYYFEKPQSCNVHCKNLAKSLNELYTEPAPSTLFPFDFTNEFPLTRSVSTTTDIFSTCSGGMGSIGAGQNNGSNKSFRTLTPQPKKRCNSQPYMANEHGSHDSLNDICGTTKGILTNRNKSKDELFVEFCKRAGQRPKPKDIYYIEKSPYDAAEESVFVIDNYGSMRQTPRNGPILTPLNIRKPLNIYNSNQSLKDVNNINSKKSYPKKNIFDSNSFGGSADTAAIFLNNRVDNYLAQQQNSSRDSNLSMYQSRTLPRDFLKRNVNFGYDDDERRLGRRVSASGIFIPFNENMRMATSSSAIATLSSIEPPDMKDTFTDGSIEVKSYDGLHGSRDIYANGKDTLAVQWPNAIPGSPSSFSNRSQIYGPNNQMYQNAMRMSSFYSQMQSGKQHTLRNDTNENNDVTTASGDKANNAMGNGEYGTFDLDRMEMERRKSHASLFEIDFINGTPV